MKYRPSKRVVWLLVPLLPLLLMFIGVWAAGSRESQASTTRGAAPPKTRSFAAGSPSTWSTAFSRPYDWYDEGITSFLNWKNHTGLNFGGRFYSLRFSKDPKDQEEYQKLMRQGGEWFEHLLARYPELAINFKPVPDDKNGLLRLRSLQNRLRENTPDGRGFSLNLPEEFSTNYHNKPEKSLEGAKAWLDANRSLVDEIRAIGLMPDRSAAGLAPTDGNATTIYDFAKILLMDARLAAARGDLSSAAESIRAADGLADHLINSEAPTLLESILAPSIQLITQRCVINIILPAIPAGQVDLSQWENALNPPLQQPADFSRVVRGEWSSSMRDRMLPFLSDTADPENPVDSEELAEAFTRHMASLARRNESIALTDLPSNPSPKSDVSDLSWRSRELAEGLGMTENGADFLKNWENRQTDVGLTRAAFAILKGQPIPNDPIYGKPYVWDPATRQLSLPDSPEFTKRPHRPITVPKL